MTAKTRKTAQPASTPTVTITHGAATRAIPYRPLATVWTLLADSIRAHGKKFADNSHLRLHTPDGTALPNTVTAENAGITPGTALTLKAPGA
jgi:hypothetical protein